MVSQRILTIGHSYVVGLNRRLAHEIAAAAGPRFDVTVVAPIAYPGDFGQIVLDPGNDENVRLLGLRMRNTRLPQLMTYERRLTAILRDRHDLIHCWEEPFILAGAQVALRKSSRTALVFATFQNIAKRYPPPFPLIERFSMSRADGWIAFGEQVRDALASRPGYAKPFRVIPLGVDTDLFRPDPDRRRAILTRLGWTEDGPPVVGFLGRFVEAKGLRFLCRVLDGTRQPWRALLVGGGTLETELRRWASKHGDRVRIATDVRHDEVPGYLNAMDLLCAPSQTTKDWREQLGRMILEAFASGIPVIASDSGEIPHVAGRAAHIAPEGNHAAWIGALETMLEDNAVRDELAGAGLERANTVFSWPIIAGKHVDFFDEILARRGTST